MHVRWDKGAAATPHGQLVFFSEFLAATGVFERWVSSCPLAYRSGNAPDKRDVLGTLMLGLLAGHRRYAHITALRGDAVAAQALGMAKVVSEDALRRALERIDQPSSAAWMRPSLMHSVQEALDRPWVLDIDASIKPLYGRQEGAEIGYNPGQAHAAQPRPAHLPGQPPAPGAGRAGELGQAAHQRARQGGAGPAAGRTGRAASCAGARRLRLRQRRHPAGAGEPQAAVPAAAAADEERAAPGGAAVRPPGLEPARQPGLPDGRGPAATARLERQAPGRHRAPAHPWRHRARAARGRQTTAAGPGWPERARGRQALGVRGAGDRRGLPAGVHRAVVPRPGRCRERF